MALDLKTVHYDYTVKRYPVKKKVTHTWWGHKKTGIEVMYDSVTTVGGKGNELTLPDYTDLSTASSTTLGEIIRQNLARTLGVSQYYTTGFVDNVLILDQSDLKNFSDDYIYTNLEVDIHFPNIGVEDFPAKVELEANALTRIHKEEAFERGMAFTYLYKKLEDAKESQADKLVLSTGRPWFKMNGDWSEDQTSRETQATEYFITHRPILEELGFKLRVSKTADYYYRDTPAYVLEISWVDLDTPSLPDFDKLPHYWEG